MFDPQPGETYRHLDKEGVTVAVIGRDPISSKIAPCVRCAAFVDGEYIGDRSIWLDKLHNDYAREPR